MKNVHGEQIPFWRANDLAEFPPVECALKVGDVVTYKNDQGDEFGGRVVVGFAKEVVFERFVHLDLVAWWAPVSMKNILPAS